MRESESSTFFIYSAPLSYHTITKNVIISPCTLFVKYNFTIPFHFISFHTPYISKLSYYNISFALHQMKIDVQQYIIIIHTNVHICLTTTIYHSHTVQIRHFHHFLSLISVSSFSMCCLPLGALGDLSVLCNVKH